MAKTEKKEPTRIEIQPIRTARLTIHLLGTSSLIMHRFAKKAWQELIMPAGRMNAAERAERLKHDPLNEFRECIYKNSDPGQPTAVHFPSGAFGKALAQAALDIPGANKSQILRLVSVKSEQVNLYGVPVLGMDMVRSSDMAKTPDVRTRAYFPEWCCELELQYVSTLIGEAQIANLMQAAGMITGLGDYRPQKGGVHGTFDVVMRDDPRYLRVKKQSRVAQEAAMATPSFYRDEDAELYGWFIEEVARREKVLPSMVGEGKVKPPKATVGVLAAKEATSKRKGRNGGASA